MTDDVPAALKAERRDALMTLQRRLVASRQQSRIGETVQVMVDGPSPESDLVWQARLPGQAPEIDPVVYLDHADPSSLLPGTLLRAVVTGARSYDLVARPIDR
jgi:ribosomal protein S12 methylthiotransferase